MVVLVCQLACGWKRRFSKASFTFSLVDRSGADKYRGDKLLNFNISLAGNVRFAVKKRITDLTTGDTNSGPKN